jgi:hypothetical protein
MLRNRARWLATILLLLLVAASPGAVAGGEPEGVLKARDLKKSGLTYVLAGEAEFLEKLADIQPHYDQVRILYSNLAAIMQNQAGYDEMDAQYKNLTEQLRDVQAEIDAHPPLTNNILRQNWNDLLQMEKQLRFQRNALDHELDLRWKTLVPEAKRERLLDEFRRKRQDFLTESRGLLAQADTLNETYDRLAKDEAVKKALDAIRTATKARVALGPSPEFKRKSTLLKSAEKAFSPAGLTARQKRRNTKGPPRILPGASTKASRS